MGDDIKGQRPARRLDAEGRTQTGPTWESVIDRQIREAMEEGKFDNLPHHGGPLPKHENPYATDMALAFDMLQNAGYAPPWIEADKEVRRLLETRDRVLERAATGQAPTTMARRLDEMAIAELVARINDAVARVNAEAPTSRQQRKALVLAEELARYEDACRR